MAEQGPGLCALILAGPMARTASAASFAVRQICPRGTGIPAGASTSDLAACSSKFIARLTGVSSHVDRSIR
jgi:hypothetical protein